LSTGEVEMVPAYEAGNPQAGMFFELDDYANPKRGAIAAWKNQMATMSWLHWLGFDGLRAAGQVRAPLLFVHGDGAVFPDHVRQIHKRLAGDKQLVWIDGSQVDFYDQPAQVDRALEAAVAHFDKTLRG
jgi:hypothetical protein